MIRVGPQLRCRLSYGAGFKIGWNLSSVISFDYGASSEYQAFYMQLGHQF
jgi:hypothetical protein